MKRDKPFKQMVHSVEGRKVCFENTVGYCSNCIHKGYITKATLDKHGCLKKNCNFFVPIEDHPYIRKICMDEFRREQIKEERRNIKENERQILKFAQNSIGDSAIFCKYLYGKIYFLAILDGGNTNSLSKDIYENLGLGVYIKRIRKSQKNNIDCTYISLLPPDMKEKVRKYKK